MSNTSPDTESGAADATGDDNGVSLAKPGAGGASATARTGRAARPKPARVTPPLTINIAAAALALAGLGNLVSGLIFKLSSHATLTPYVQYLNSQQKKPKKPYTLADINSDIHKLQSSVLVQDLIICVVMLLLAYSLRSTRSTRTTRWIILVVMVFTTMPLGVVPNKHLPTGGEVCGVVIGLAAIAALLLIFVPKPSQQYFRDCRDANLPPEMRGQPRPGLASLFGPKRARPTATTATGPAARRPTAPAQTRPAAAPKAKAKVRADSDAVAKGAELARSRAKASKSRRSS